MLATDVASRGLGMCSRGYTFSRRSRRTPGRNRQSRQQKANGSLRSTQAMGWSLEQLPESTSPPSGW